MIYPTARTLWSLNKISRDNLIVLPNGLKEQLLIFFKSRNANSINTLLNTNAQGRHAFVEDHLIARNDPSSKWGYYKTVGHWVDWVTINTIYSAICCHHVSSHLGPNFTFSKHVCVMSATLYRPKQVGDNPIRDNNALEFQCMGSFVTIKYKSLIFLRPTNRSDSAIYETPTIV